MVNKAEGDGEGADSPKPAQQAEVVPSSPQATDSLALEMAKLVSGSPLIEDSRRATDSLERLLEGDLVRQARKIQNQIDAISSPHLNLARAIESINNDSLGVLLRAQGDMLDLYRAPIAELLRQQEEYAAGPMAQLLVEMDRLKAFDISSLMPEPFDLSAVIGASIDSAATVAEVRSIGLGVSFGLGFEAAFSSALREDVGDWRDEIQWPTSLGSSVVAREAFYVERGLSIDVTEISASQLEAVFGLSTQEPKDEEDPLVIVVGGDGDERAAQGFRKLRQLEVQMRRWIDALMTKEFGGDWPSSRVAPKTRDAWHEKQGKAEKRGLATGRLIDFADFMDYQQVICMDGNWSRVFIHGFERPENVRESFQRLHPTRLAVMHGRNISNADLLYLIVEVARLRSCLERLVSKA